MLVEIPTERAEHYWRASRNGYGVVYNSRVVAEKGRELERLPTPPVPVKIGTYWLKEAT